VRPASPEAPEGSAAARRTLDFRPVLANRPALAFILGYAGHAWELFALRSWLAAFLVQAAMLAGDDAGNAQASWLSVAIVLISTSASIYGVELATRSDRRRVIGRIMLLSVAATVTGFSAGRPIYLVAALALLYHMIIMGDSAALTGGAVATAASGQRGAILAVHSVLGFSGGFFGPLAVGLVLDLAGGQTSRLAWGLAFLTMGEGLGRGLRGDLWALRLFLSHHRQRLRHFLGWDVALVRGERPAVAETVGEHAGAVAPEHVRRRGAFGHAGGHRFLVQGIDILDVEIKASAAAVLRRDLSHLWHLIVEENRRVADADAGMDDLGAAGHLKAPRLHRAERALIEVDRRGAVFDGNLRRDAVIPFGAIAHGVAAFCRCGLIAPVQRGHPDSR
jgi:hypothetical protein